MAIAQNGRMIKLQQIYIQYMYVAIENYYVAIENYLIMFWKNIERR